MMSLLTAVAPASRVFTTRITDLSEKLPQQHGVPAFMVGTVQIARTDTVSGASFRRLRRTFYLAADYENIANFMIR